MFDMQRAIYSKELNLKMSNAWRASFIVINFPRLKTIIPVMTCKQQAVMIIYQ